MILLAPALVMPTAGRIQDLCQEGATGKSETCCGEIATRFLRDVATSEVGVTDHLEPKVGLIAAKAAHGVVG